MLASLVSLVSFRHEFVCILIWRKTEAGYYCRVVAVCF